VKVLLWVLIGTAALRALVWLALYLVKVTSSAVMSMSEQQEGQRARVRLLDRTVR
jgi:hypothetical protein